MIDYIIFFGMFIFAIVLYWLHRKKLERRLYDALKARGEYIRTQVPCGRYSIDIALPTYHIAIECDGVAYQ